MWKSGEYQNECFKREIDITLNLDHENVVKCHGIYEDLSAIHLVLELIAGGDLFDHIVHSPLRRLTENEAIGILEQILRALNYLHFEKKVAHRDVKPENFLMYNEKGRNKVRLIDFGFATYIPPDGLMSQQLGTPQYAAPELFLEQQYTAKVDVWSAGIVLFNMINGSQPFACNKNCPDLIKDQVLNKEIDFSGFTNPQLRTLCQHLLERDPNKRPTATQALCEISLIHTDDESMQTLPANFEPDIHKIIYILSNDRALGDEIKNFFLTHLNLDEIIRFETDIKKRNQEETGTGMFSGKLYLQSSKLIQYALDFEYLSENFKQKCAKFREGKGLEKLEKKLINLNTFFITLREGKKFIMKQRVWNAFCGLDTSHYGYLTKNQIDKVFVDETKRKNIPNIKQGERIDFEKFYHLWNDYEGIVV